MVSLLTHHWGLIGNISFALRYNDNSIHLDMRFLKTYDLFSSQYCLIAFFAVLPN